MSWKVGEAKQRFSEVVRAAAAEPQPIYRRNELVGAVVGPNDLEKLRRLRAREVRSLGEIFAEIRSICADEDFAFEPPRRSDRPNDFADVLDTYHAG